VNKPKVSRRRGADEQMCRCADCGKGNLGEAGLDYIFLNVNCTVRGGEKESNSILRLTHNPRDLLTLLPYIALCREICRCILILTSSLTHTAVCSERYESTANMSGWD
jgi:hypothetical protein